MSGSSKRRLGLWAAVALVGLIALAVAYVVNRPFRILSFVASDVGDTIFAGAASTFGRPRGFDPTLVALPAEYMDVASQLRGQGVGVCAIGSNYGVDLASCELGPFVLVHDFSLKSDIRMSGDGCLFGESVNRNAVDVGVVSVGALDFLNPAAPGSRFRIGSFELWPFLSAETWYLLSANGDAIGVFCHLDEGVASEAAHAVIAACIERSQRPSPALPFPWFGDDSDCRFNWRVD